MFGKFKTLCRTAVAILTLFAFINTVFAAENGESVFTNLLIIHNMEDVTGSDGNTYHPVHIYTGIDSLDYNEVGFDVSAKNSESSESETYSSATAAVYENMEVTETDGEVKRYSASDLGGKYMFGCELLFNAENWSNKLTEISITPYAIGADGATVKGGTAEVTDESIKNNKPGSALFREKGQTIVTAFENTDKYLYRVGNRNSVAVGNLFKAADGAQISSAVDVKITSVAGNVTWSYTQNMSDWTQGTIKFANTGVVKITVAEQQAEAAELNLEIVDGKNVTEYADMSGSVSCVLLNDIKMSKNGSLSMKDGTTIYGNGFKFDITDGSNTAHGIVVLSNASIDNLNLAGAVYTEYAASSSSNYFANAVQTSGNSKITNSFISNCRSPVRVMGGTLTISDTTLFGGRYANLNIFAGTVNLNNVTTFNMPYEGVLGLGIVFNEDANDAALNISGSLTQYNWVKKADNSCLPSTNRIKNLFDSMFTGTAYSGLRYKYNGTDYINTGILSLTNSVATDNVTGVPSDYVCVKPSSGFVYSVSNTYAPSYFADGVPAYGGWSPSAQGVYAPVASWSYPNIYNSDLGKLMAVFEEGSGITFDPNFLSVSKHGMPLSVKVAMDGVDYTGKNITLTESGSHTLTFSYDDPYNYNAAAEEAETVTYTYTVPLESTANKPDVKHAEFSYTGDWSSYKVKTAEISGKTYIMPDVSETSTNISSVTVGNQTVYCPLVEAQYHDNSSDFNAYAPIFSAVNITDYDASGTATFYNTNTKSMPENLSLTPSTSGAGYISSATKTPDPVTYSNYGLCWKSLKGADITAEDHYAEYTFTDNAGQTYYYFLHYSFPAHKVPTGCIPSGTLVTLADGTQKPVENITMNDRLLVFNHETGRADNANIAFIENDGKNIYNVVNLRFSDGSVTRLIYEHGYFDLDLMKYVYIRENNCEQFVGHRFLKGDYNGTEYNSEAVTLEKAWVTEEYTGCYSFPTKYHLNFFADGFLSMPGGIEGMFNIFDYDETLKYDQEKMNADIKQYGLFDYSDFEQYMSYEEYMQYPAAYLKVSLGKGLMTKDYLNYLIERYVKQG